MKTINLITAILSTINSFGSDSFSIYNITRSIREDVNDGVYNLEDYHDIVDHDIVKKYFLQLMDNNAIAPMTEQYNAGGYREYQRNDIQAQPAVQPTTTSLPNVAQVSNNSIFPMDVQRKMYHYIKDNGPVTMKQIQSRLKGYTSTCSDIRDFLTKLNLIDPTTLANADSKVSTLKFS